MECAFDNECVYKGKDEFMEFFNANMQDQDVADICRALSRIAFSVRVVKMVLDRSFFNGHIPTQIGKQVGHIVSGPLAQAQFAGDFAGPG